MTTETGRLPLTFATAAAGANIRFQPQMTLDQIKRFGEAIIPEATKL